MAYALAQSGTITGLTSQSVAGWQILMDVRSRDVSNAAAASVFSEHETGRYSYSLTGSSFFYQGSAYPKPIEVTFTNGVVACIKRARIVARQFLKDDTCASDANGTRVYSKGKWTYTVNCIGTLQDDETPLETATLAITTVTLPLSTTHTISGAGKLIAASYDNDGARGGSVDVPFTIVLSGTITYAGTGNPFGATNTPISEYTADITLDNGKDWDGTVVVSEVTALVDYNSGLPTVLNFVLPFNGAITIGDTGA